MVRSLLNETVNSYGRITQVRHILLMANSSKKYFVFRGDEHTNENYKNCKTLEAYKIAFTSKELILIQTHHHCWITIGR